MMRDILDTIAETTWRDWLASAAEFAGMAVIVASIALVCACFMPHLN